MRIGAIGVDSSHLPEFTKRIKAMHDEGATPCQVTHVFDPGGHDLPDAPKWLESARQMGVAQVGSMEELLSSVDGVMVLSKWEQAPGAVAAEFIQRSADVYRQAVDVQSG